MIVEPALSTDVMVWADARRAHGFPLPRAVGKCLLAQIAVSEAFTLRETVDGAPLVICGCLDLEACSAGEVFFMGPNGGLGRSLLRVTRIVSRWLAEAAVSRPWGFVCHVRQGNEQGRRLARLLGFTQAGVVMGFEQWRRG
jgi:hypothetical protein